MDLLEWPNKMKPRKISIYHVAEAVKSLWILPDTPAHLTATHRYMCRDIVEILAKAGYPKISLSRMGFALQALQVLPTTDRAEDCRYYYLSPRNTEGHDEFINPKKAL